MALYAEKHMPTLVRNSPAFKARNYKQALIDSFLGFDRSLLTPEGKKELDEINAAIPSKSPVFGQPESADLASFVGCTACVALITKTEIYVANSGDSRAVLSKNGIAINMSEDHKPDLELEKRRIEQAGGYVEDNRVNGVLNLSRSLGDMDYKQNKKLKPEDQIITAMPDVKVEKIANETEFLLIGCDGVWDCLTSQEAIDYVGDQLKKSGFKQDKPFHLSKILESMLDKIIAPDIEAKGMCMIRVTPPIGGLGCDNMTSVLVYFKKPN
ncbi:MAG: PP2C family protein-serine/threonine phosphatase [Acidobacteriaceae bacterium]|nr:PP2C family protein-serine/threonine phosphatase [Acidobacteriaceae bacterium]